MHVVTSSSLHACSDPPHLWNALFSAERACGLAAQIASQVNNFLLAGHETTAAALAFTVYHIASNPAAEARLLAEVDAFGRHAVPTVDDLARVRCIIRFWFCFRLHGSSCSAVNCPPALLNLSVNMGAVSSAVDAALLQLSPHSCLVSRYHSGDAVSSWCCRS